MNSIFSPEKFKKITLNPIKSDLRKYRNLVAKLRPHLSKEDETLVKPLEGLKRAYGIPKLHKQGAPVRPIVSSLFNITSRVDI